MDTKRKTEIAAAARELERDIWMFRGEIWPNQAVDRFDCLNPEAACKFFDVHYEPMYEEGDLRFTGGRIVGELNRSLRTIKISDSLPYGERRFTLAHELGHWKLHKDINMHRERPVIYSASGTQRPLKEQEADYFAACLLMPEDLVIQEFAKRFGKHLPLHIDDHVAWKLNSADPGPLVRTSQDSKDRELALAKCENFGQRHFVSLTTLFGVSLSAMAIRINELNLIKWP